MNYLIEEVVLIQGKGQTVSFFGGVTLYNKKKPANSWLFLVKESDLVKVLN